MFLPFFAPGLKTIKISRMTYRKIELKKLTFQFCSESLNYYCDVTKKNSSKGRYVFSWEGRAGASEGRVISESEPQKGRAIPHVSYSRKGHTSFPD